MTTTTTVTEQQIKTLATEAGSAGDLRQVRLCEAALRLGEESSEWRECAQAIADAQAQAD